MKIYALYDMKEFEQCVIVGNIKEVSKFLGEKVGSLRSYLTRKKNGRQNLLKHRYELTEIVENFYEEETEILHKKNNNEIFQELLEIFKIKPIVFPEFDELKWKLKGFVDKIIIDEEWKEIDGTNYSISNYGRVRNDKNNKIKSLRWHKWILQVDIYKNGKRYTCGVARLTANYFIRQVKENERVTYIDGDARNNYYKNLKIVSKEKKR